MLYDFLVTVAYSLQPFSFLQIIIVSFLHIFRIREPVAMPE